MAALSFYLKNSERPHLFSRESSVTGQTCKAGAHQRRRRSPAPHIRPAAVTSGSPLGRCCSVWGLWQGLRGFIMSFCLFGLAYFSFPPCSSGHRRTPASKSQRTGGMGRRRSRKGATPAEQEREAPSTESRPLCPPPPGPCLGQNIAQSNYCLLGKGYGILLQLFMKENIWCFCGRWVGEAEFTSLLVWK